jgi:hypothetical protein
MERIQSVRDPVDPAGFKLFAGLDEREASRIKPVDRLGVRFGRSSLIETQVECAILALTKRPKLRLQAVDIGDYAPLLSGLSQAQVLVVGSVLRRPVLPPSKGIYRVLEEVADVFPKRPSPK